MAVHVAITRRVKPGREAEFEESLRGFFQDSLDRPGVLGVHLLRPAPGSASREYGVLRSFASEGERRDFYDSSFFREWEQRVRACTEGDPQRRDLHGMEAWFREAHGAHPPRWKMALATLLGVYPASLAIPPFLQPLLTVLPTAVGSLLVSAVMVAALTWLIMPVLTRALRDWLQPQT